MRVLITGAAGFIGHHVLSFLMQEHPTWRFTVIDPLDVSGNYNRLAEVGLPDPRVTIKYPDLRAPISDQLMGQLGEHEYIVHMAAATHVDRSIDDPLDFVYNNVVATCNVLNYARRVGCDKLVNFGTDEVFGPAPPGVAYREDDRYRSGNPYAATKAGAEELGVAFHNTYKLPVITTHTMNVIGERQHPEKFLPMTVAKVLRGEVVTVHADASRRNPGSRFYIHARDVARAIDLLLRRGVPGEKYNVVGATETDNLRLARIVAGALGRNLKFELVDFHSSRPGHDLRYALDGSKLRSFGWGCSAYIDEVIAEVALWYEANPRWLVDGLSKVAA